MGARCAVSRRGFFHFGALNRCPLHKFLLLTAAKKCIVHQLLVRRPPGPCPPTGLGRGGGGSRCYCVGRSWCPVHFFSSVRGGENCTGHGLLLTRWCRFDGHLGKRVGKYSRLLISPRRKARAFCSLTSELEHSHVCTHRPLTVRAMRILSVSQHCQCASTCLDARSHRWIAATQWGRRSWPPLHSRPSRVGTRHRAPS